jgi:hypothetical protein
LRPRLGCAAGGPYLPPFPSIERLLPPSSPSWPAPHARTYAAPPAVPISLLLLQSSDCCLLHLLRGRTPAPRHTGSLPPLLRWPLRLVGPDGLHGPSGLAVLRAGPARPEGH